jgi:sugar phosphate permease
VIGLVQSVEYPCLVGTIAAWTTKSSRGRLTGIWSTNGNVGEIIGLQLSVVIMKYQGEWQYLMFYSAASYIGWAFIIYFFFIASPAEVGVTLQTEILIP